MSRRVRAAGFASAAAVCAALAAGATGGERAGESEPYGALREVVVAAGPLPARRPVGRTVAAASLEIRRVPERFVPPDALTSPAQALGRRPATDVPAGGYLLASQFESRGSRGAGGGEGPLLAADRRPVEIAVSGAAAVGTGSPGRVDVVVTDEPSAGGANGRTYVAAEGVRLLDLRAATEGPGGEPVAAPAAGSWIATLALTRAQALRLIHAQSFARDIRLIGA